MASNPYNHDVEDQHAELVSALIEAFEEAGHRNIELLAQIAVDVMCDNASATFDLLADVEDWIAELRTGPSDSDWDYRTQ